MYSAWWEILPASSTPISTLTISPGDTVCASITEGTGSEWTLSITDETTEAQFTTTQSYGGPADSAEWILERPEVCDPNCDLSTLADYGQSTPLPCLGGWSQSGSHGRGRH